MSSSTWEAGGGKQALRPVGKGSQVPAQPYSAFHRWDKHTHTQSREHVVRHVATERTVMKLTERPALACRH